MAREGSEAPFSRSLRRPHGLLNGAGATSRGLPWSRFLAPDFPIPAAARDRFDDQKAERPTVCRFHASEISCAASFPDHSGLIHQ